MTSAAEHGEAGPARSNVLALADPRTDAGALRQRWHALADRNAGPAALVSLAFDHCHAMVFSIANRITGSRWEAEDVTQAVFEALLRQLPRVRDPDRIPGFLRTCSVRMSLRHVKRGRWRRARLRAEHPVPGEPAIDDPVDAAALVRQLLARLDPEERAAVVLKHVELCTHEEIAEHMGTSVATARRRLASGRARLEALVGSARAAEILDVPAQEASP
jgi:RNA polymerase sigma-70 factor (ECF subfamily)